MAFCAELNRKAATVAVTPQLFYQVLADNEAKIGAYRQSLERAAALEAEGRTDEAKQVLVAAGRVKNQLPGFIFQSESFTPHRKKDKKTGKEDPNSAAAAWREQKYALLNGLCMLDVDHVDDPVAVFTEQVQPSIDNGNPCRIRMAFVTPSGKGLKLVFEADLQVGNLASNQLKVAQTLGLEPDMSCKDAARLAFATGKQDLLFLEPSVFDYKDEAYAEKYNPQYNEGKSQPDLFGAGETRVESGETRVESTQKEPPLCNFEEYRYADRFMVSEIIDAWLDGEEPKQGQRHDTLLRLASELRHVTEMNGPLILHEVRKLKWVQDIIDRGEDVEKTVADAMAYRYTGRMPQRMERALRKLEQLAQGPEMAEPVRQRFRDFGQRIGQLARHFPTLQLVLEDFEVDNYAPVMFVSSALYGTLATRTWYHYWYDPHLERRLNYGIFIIADPASGKSFANSLYKTILEPILVSDQAGNDAVNNYKHAVKERATSSKEQKKDALKAPVVKVRNVGARTANGVFIEYMVNCKEIVGNKQMNLHLFTFDSELDASTAASKGGQWIDKSIFELKAFHNEEDNQQYRNTDSVNGPFDVFWNFVYTGTPLALNRKVNERNFGSGLYSRLAALPLNTDPYEVAAFKTVTQRSTERLDKLKEWAYRLDKMQGELPLDGLLKPTWEWVREQMDVARIEQSKAKAFICRRVPYYGINIAAPFIVMRHWEEWEKTRTFQVDSKDVELCLLAMEIQWYSQQYFFGKYAEMYYDEKKKLEDLNAVRHSEKIVSYFNTLPQEFTTDEMITMLAVSRDNANALTSRWFAEGLITRKGTKRNRVYVKCLVIREK